jgi:RHS repeat-associated protein
VQVISDKEDSPCSFAASEGQAWVRHKWRHTAGGAGDQHLSYDGLDRLTLANGPYGTNGANASLTYTYDELGNLTFNSQVGIYTYPTSGSTSVHPHAVTAAGSNTYSYDANGNLTSGAGRTLTYNLENKPLTITIAGQTTTFVYDGDGGRAKKIAGTTTTRYISKIYECDNASCSRMVFAGGQRIATIGASGTIYYYHTDHLGSSSVITDIAGAKVQALTYFPYGATRTNNSTGTPAIDVPYKYTGKELDSSTNLYYYEARYYDPTLGRFLSADMIVPNPRNPQDLNRYTYVRNNPFRYTDPTGHFSIVKALGRILDNKAVRVAGWIVAPPVFVFMDPATRNYALPAAAGTLGYLACGPVGPVCAGAFAGTTSALLAQADGKNVNIIRAGLGGAAGGAAGAFATGIPGCSVFCGGAAAGAVNAAITGRDPGKAAIRGAIAALPMVAITIAGGMPQSPAFPSQSPEPRPDLNRSSSSEDAIQVAGVFDHIDAGGSVTIGTKTYQYTLRDGFSEQFTMPPQVGVSFDGFYNKPPDSLSPIETTVGIGEHESVGTFFYNNPDANGTNQSVLQGGFSIHLGKSWPPSPINIQGTGK